MNEVIFLSGMVITFIAVSTFYLFKGIFPDGSYLDIDSMEEVAIMGVIALVISFLWIVILIAAIMLGIGYVVMKAIVKLVKYIKSRQNKK